MKTWYKAVCDKCGEAQDVMVNDPLCSAGLLGDRATEIKKWLEKHYGCDSLRLIWRDDQMDKLWEEGYESLDRKYNLLTRQ
jgi:hypothetical protein